MHLIQPFLLSKEWGVPQAISTAQQLNKEVPGVFSIMKDFADEPLANFDRFMSIEDLEYWLWVYFLVHEEKNYLDEVLDRQFQIADIDETKLDILFSILLKYHTNQNTISELEYHLINHLLRIFEYKPGWFLENLFRQVDWRLLIRKVSRWYDIYSGIKDKRFKDRIIGLVEESKKKEVALYFEELDKEIEDEYILLNCFVKELDRYADAALGIKNWGTIISRYWKEHTNEKLVITDDPLETIGKWILIEPNVVKIKILFSLIENLRSDYPAEYIHEVGAKAFLANPGLFIRCLEDRANWRYLLFRISDELFYWIDLEKLFAMLRDDGFEGKVKNELIFMSKLPAWF